MIKSSSLKISKIYFGSLLIALVAHYFLISKIKINSTLQTGISFFIFTILMGVFSLIFDK